MLIRDLPVAGMSPLLRSPRAVFEKNEELAPGAL